VIGTEYSVRIKALTVNGSGPSTGWLSTETFLHDLDGKKYCKHELFIIYNLISSFTIIIELRIMNIYEAADNTWTLVFGGRCVCHFVFILRMSFMAYVMSFRKIYQDFVGIIWNYYTASLISGNESFIIILFFIYIARIYFFTNILFAHYHRIYCTRKAYVAPCSSSYKLDPGELDSSYRAGHHDPRICPRLRHRHPRHLQSDSRITSAIPHHQSA